MKKIKILHLFAGVLDLYGDYKNLTVLGQRLVELGHTCEIVCPEPFDAIDPSGYDMIYIGHGKARNLAAIAPHFVSHADAIRASIESGQLWLVTGNARELFGRGFTTVDGTTVDGVGVFDYFGIENNQVFVSDMVGRPDFNKDELVYGFANRTASLKGENHYPLFEVSVGFNDGEFSEGREGTHYKNFYGTWCMGPILARNPAMMREFLRRLLGDEYRECDFTLEQNALDSVLSEFRIEESEAK